MFKCKVCGIELQSQANYHHHTQTGQTLQCFDCLETFDSLCALRNHRKTVHPREFEESRKLVQDPSITVKLLPRQDTPNTNAGLSDIGNTRHSRRPDEKPNHTGSSAKQENLIGGLSEPAEEPDNFDKAIEALMEALRKRCQQNDPKITSNRSFQSVPTISVPVAQNEIVKREDDDTQLVGWLDTEHRAPESQIAKIGTTSDMVSNGSVSTHLYSQQSENAYPVKRVKRFSTASSNDSELATTLVPTQPHQATQQPHSEARIVCFECEATFSTIIGLHHHQIMCEHNYCKECLGFFHDRTLLDHHRRMMHSYNCAICQLVCKSWEEQREHQRQSEHGYCKSCDSYFFDKESHKKHLNFHTGPKFKCPICNAAFGTEEVQKAHQRAIQHGYCRVCFRYFSDQASYSKHLDSHKSNTYSCPICKAVFATEIDRSAHRRQTKHGYCQDCNRYFLDQASCLKHMEMHSNMTFKCPTCGVGLSTEEARNTHQRVNRHAFCCNRVFQDEQSAKQHIAAVHPHRCGVFNCNTFHADSALLTAHQKKSHPYCELCNRAFLDVTALSAHIGTSTSHADKVRKNHRK
ncbi:hypothetical protein AJ79_08590 [Helicocarpus griseus UAMH5409]|uniref:C2H2-type domain-containing protein n=1 Tax=Helicocarpus griseus UAMH5409 TaxID=1447875 RepID=A0A2B7WRK7_9EURO|nr:hypothetical protein AJ79_08590 [Helicocarpus griseus UAMH5409]